MSPDGPIGYLLEGVSDIYPWLKYITTKLEDILSNQDEINARVTRISAAVSVIAQEIADLKAQPAAEALDFSGLDAAIASVEALEPAAPAAS